MTHFTAWPCKGPEPRQAAVLWLFSIAPSSHVCCGTKTAPYLGIALHIGLSGLSGRGLQGEGKVSSQPLPRPPAPH